MVTWTMVMNRSARPQGADPAKRPNEERHMSATILLEHALAAWEKAKAGEPVIVSDAHLDLLADHFRDDDSLEADVYFRHSSSPHNPEQVGVLDAYLLRLSDKGRALLESQPTSTPRP